MDLSSIHDVVRRRSVRSRVGTSRGAARNSLAKEQRLDAEQRLKHGKLKALVANASLSASASATSISSASSARPARLQVFSSASAGPAMRSRARQRAAYSRSVCISGDKKPQLEFLWEEKRFLCYLHR